MTPAAILSRSVSKRILLAVAAAAIVLTVSFDSLAVRMSGLPVGNHCYYQLVRNFPDDVDVVLMGSSRMLQGVDPDELGKHLGEPGGPSRVVSIAHPGYLVSVDRILLQLLLQRTVPKIIVIETQLSIENENKPVHKDPALRRERNKANADAIYLVSSYRDLTEPVLRTSDLALVPWLHATLRDLQRKVDRSVKLTFAGRVAQTVTGANAREMDGRGNICFVKAWSDPLFYDPKPVELKRKAALKRSFERRNAEWLADGSSRAKLRDKQVALYRDTVQLAQRHGARVVFAHLPLYYVWPPGPEFRDAFEREIGAPIIWPDKFLLKRLQDENGYRDHSHLTPHGRQLTSAWLADVLGGLGPAK